MVWRRRRNLFNDIFILFYFFESTAHSSKSFKINRSEFAVHDRDSHLWLPYSHICHTNETNIWNGVSKTGAILIWTRNNVIANVLFVWYKRQEYWSDSKRERDKRKSFHILMRIYVCVLLYVWMYVWMCEYFVVHKVRTQWYIEQHSQWGDLHWVCNFVRAVHRQKKVKQMQKFLF